MTRKLVLFGAMLAAIAACEGTIDEKHDAAADADGDADSDSGEEGCSMNSGAFCTCDMPFGGNCDDGTPCLLVRNLGTPDLGFCSPSCDCDNYDDVCSVDGAPEGVVPRCIMAGDWPIEDSTLCNCVLMNCTEDTDCPEGQVCHEIVGTHGQYEGVTIYICSPP